MLSVACVLSGGIYDRGHVTRLANMVSGRLARPFTFRCVDDSPFPGWWAKVSLFEPGRFKGRVLYLDLDVTVTGGLDDLADFPAPFVIIDDWNRKGCNSSVMAWDAGAADHVFTRFAPEVMDRLPGDQDWIGEQMPDARVFPQPWCRSYKKSVYGRLDGGAPKDCRVVVFHGRPKPWEVANVA